MDAPGCNFFRICEDFARPQCPGRARERQNPWWILVAERNRLAYPKKIAAKHGKTAGDGETPRRAALSAVWRDRAGRARRVPAKPRSGRLCLPHGAIVLVARDACPQIPAWDVSAVWRDRACVQVGPVSRAGDRASPYSAYLSMRLPPQELPHPAAQL